MPDSIVVTQLSQLATKHAEQFRDIYFDSFPPHERADFSCLIDSIANGSRWFFAAIALDDLLGFAILVPYVASDFHLLEYLAVASDERNGGIGSIILSSVVATLRAPGNTAGLLIEVEPDDEGDAVERRMRAGRIRFYQQRGAQVVECAPYYRVPMANSEKTMRMKLLWVKISKNAKTPHGEKLCECIRGIFEKSYGLGADSSLLQSNLEELIC